MKNESGCYLCGKTISVFDLEIVWDRHFHFKCLEKFYYELRDTYNFRECEQKK